MIVSLESSINLGQGEEAGGWLMRIAVEMNVPAQVVGRGQDHDAGVVHPLARLPLSTGQVSQVLLSSWPEDIDQIVNNVLGQLFCMITNLQIILLYIHSKEGSLFLPLALKIYDF